MIRELKYIDPEKILPKRFRDTNARTIHQIISEVGIENLYFPPLPPDMRLRIQARRQGRIQ